MSGLRDLGEQVARLQDADRELLRAADQAGERFIRTLRQRARPTRKRSLLMAALVGLVAVLLGAMGLAQRVASAPLAVSPGVDVGDAIRAPRDQTIPLRFSDGSEVRLDAGTEAVVRALTAHGASLDLTRGSASVSVKHGPQTQWDFHAGPYAVRVIGTRFDLAWTPDGQRFALDLWEGAVRVSAEGNGHAAVEMVAPERLVIDATGWHLSRLGGSAPPAPGAASDEPTTAAVPSPSASTSPVDPDGSTPRADDWEALARDGKYQDAYAAARQRGLDSLTQAGSASQLLVLAETCRLSGHGADAVTTLSRLRARFASSEEASVAAFQLGRLAGGGAASAQWFRTYLAERPNGGLAREASGRLLEALDRSGARAEARAAAKRYLSRYPAGPHAAFAQRIVDN